MTSRLKLVITATWLCHLFMGAPLVISQARPGGVAVQDDKPVTDQAGYCHLSLISSPLARPGRVETDAKNGEAKPQAGRNLRLPISESQPVNITARSCEKLGDVYTLRGDVSIDFREYTLQGDAITYDATTGDVTAEGNVTFDGGVHDVRVTASRGTVNVHTQLGKFYDVSATTGTHFKNKNVSLTSSAPITFTGKMVEKTGTDEYVIYHGSVTSCELPHPKWKFTASKIVLEIGGSARIHNTVFHTKGVPVIYLPFAALPAEKLGRQTGFLIPSGGTSSSKGNFLGDSFYWAINRSMDATLGAEYFSKRGWSLREMFRATPTATSYLNFDYFSVLDRGLHGKTSATTTGTVDQGGQDVKLNGEALFFQNIRGVASLDYLSSFLFRQAFTENFSQAVDSEVKSVLFASRRVRGFSLNTFASRYQNFQSTSKNDVISIIHAPGFEVSSVDQKAGPLPFYWTLDAAAEELKRSQPGFHTPNLVTRLDAQPAISLPLLFRDWSLRSELAFRDTYYSDSQQPSLLIPGNSADQTLNRRALETVIELRPPALGKIFGPTFFDRKIKHVIEPRIVYHYTSGEDSLPSVIRFDYRDILSDANDLEFGLTQRLYLKRRELGCDESGQLPAGGADARPTPTTSPCPPAGASEFLTWDVKAKYFFDPTFGGVIFSGKRNVLSSTVDYTGIAFLTDPRRFSPIVSRLRMRTTGNSDLEWQVDYDSKKGRVNASTFLATIHLGDIFVGGSHAYLQAPGEFVLDQVTNQALPPCIRGLISQPACIPNQFNQIRGLLGYGNPGKRGLSAAANFGFDSFFHFLQYSAAQSSYNWDCCGISVEYRRFALLSVRNENQFRFSFTLANIATFGNLKRQLRLL
ncbi:MAG TPA: LPS assembly protein LptD [Alphaproteobacteria bacterium]|nr:LPS assembly protein LptD [Alphaproteobacteria bacterium]